MPCPRSKPSNSHVTLAATIYPAILIDNARTGCGDVRVFGCSHTRPFACRLAGDVTVDTHVMHGS